MKNRSLYFSGLLVLLISVTYGFSRLESRQAPTDVVNGWSHNSNFVNGLVNQLNKSKAVRLNDMNFFIHGITGRPVSKMDLEKADKIDDIIPGYPSNWIEYYDAVWIKNQSAYNALSFMSRSNKLSEDQKALIHQAAVGSVLDIVINYHLLNKATGEFEYDRMSIGLNIVPEIEAIFPNGLDSLIRYFETNSSLYFSHYTMQDFRPIEIKFLINTIGNPEHIRLTSKSGYPEVDAFLLQLLKDMPPWQPAQNSNGAKCKQAFELIVGPSGC